MHANSTKRKLAAGAPVSVVETRHASPSLVEFVAQLGFDAVFLDIEHGGGSWEDLENMIRAAELGGATPIVRVQDNTASIIARSLDRGAGGIQVPHVNTLEEAAAAVQHAKYAPLGHRGWYTGRPTYRQSITDYPSHANDETLVVVTLEEVEALRNLDEILTAEHVDAFCVAPGDLAQSMGLPGQGQHPEVRKAIDDAIVRIVRANRVAGIPVTHSNVKQYLDLGARYLLVGLPNLLTPGVTEFLDALS
jgi:4-hydroxy-2-oxoheptanedioate aldolase